MSRISRVGSVLRLVGALVFPIIAMTCASRAGEADKSATKTWGTAVEGQALSISSEKAAYAPGERIVLNVCFKNVAQTDVKVVETSPLAMYHVDVLLPGGKPAPLTLFGRQRTESKPFARSVETLKPGEETCAHLELSRLFDFTLAGTYTVSVERAVWKDGVGSSTLKAKSNKLEITIDESLSRDTASAGAEGGNAAKSD